MDLRVTQERQTLLAVRLREAIAAELGDRTRTWLGEEIGMKSENVGRLLNGHIAISLEHVVAIEDALDVPRGHLLRAAGYVDSTDLPALEHLVSYDERFNVDQRSALLKIVRAFVEEQVPDKAKIPAVTPLRAAAAKSPRVNKPKGR